MDARILARRIGAIIERSSISVNTEGAAHRAIQAALAREGIEAATEVQLGPGERIDLLVGAVGIEVKVQGTRREVYRQLQRYAACDQIEALVLATGAAWPAMQWVDKTPLVVASLARGWL